MEVNNALNSVENLLDSEEQCSKSDVKSSKTGTAPHNSHHQTSAACTSKRANYISWDEYFMSVAMLSAQRSKDPNRQVGACVVNCKNKIVGVGYNGFPIGCSDDAFPWGKLGDSDLDTKYPYVCHAEMNAIVNRNSADLSDCKIYVTLFPCNECMKLLIQSGIREIIYGSDVYHDTNKVVASRRMMMSANVRERKFVSHRKSVTLDFSFEKPN